MKCKPGFFEGFSWGPEFEFLSWPIVEPVEDVVQLFLGECCEVGSLGEVLADEAVCVFVYGPVIGGVRAGKVDVHVQCLFKRFEGGEFFAVVKG